jgi:hypothetical protein
MKFGFPSVLTVWNMEKFGNKVASYVADLQIDKFAYDNIDPSATNFDEQFVKKIEELDTTTLKKDRTPDIFGRPILITLTETGYIFINVHNPQGWKESLNQWKSTRYSLQYHLNKFIDSLSGAGDVSLEKIFIMGDFNDPSGGLLSPILELMGSNYHIGPDQAPRSCCYNYNSSCINNDNPTAENTYAFKDKELTIPLPNFRDARGENDLGDERDVYLKYPKNAGSQNNVDVESVKVRQSAHKTECYRTTNEATGKSNFARPLESYSNIGKINDQRDIEVNIPNAYPDRNLISSYRYLGDYCFVNSSIPVISSLKIYRPNGSNQQSIESDHEMVFMEI